MTTSAITGKIGKEDCTWYNGVSTTFTRKTSVGGTLTLTKMGSVVDVAQVGGSLTAAAINSVISQIPSTSNVILEMSPGNWVIDTNVTIPSNLIVSLVPGANLQVADGITVTMPVPIAYRCSHFQLTGSGAVSFSGTGLVKPDWWGNNTTPGTTDMTAEIAAAVTAIGTNYSDLSFSGEYYVSDDLTITVYCNCLFPYGAKIKIADTKLVTFEGTIEAGPYQIFNDQNATLDGVAVTSAIGYWQWWGSDATAYAAAIAAGITPMSSEDYVDTAIATAVLLTGDQTVAGVKTFTSIPVGPAADPTTDNQFARKSYVDNSAKIAYAVIEDQKTAGSHGGGASATSWQTRVLNTTVVDADSIIIALASNQFTLDPGTYRIRASAPAKEVNQHMIRLANITAGTYPAYGTSEQAQNTITVINRSWLSYEFTIAAQSIFEIQHYTTSAASTDGLGRAVNIGVAERYTQVEIWKV